MTIHQVNNKLPQQSWNKNCDYSTNPHLISWRRLVFQQPHHSGHLVLGGKAKMKSSPLLLPWKRQTVLTVHNQPFQSNLLQVKSVQIAQRCLKQVLQLQSWFKISFEQLIYQTADETCAKLLSFFWTLTNLYVLHESLTKMPAELKLKNFPKVQNQPPATTTTTMATTKW